MTVSKRTEDVNGWMLVRDNPLTKAGVYPYMGHEIHGAPDPDKLYYVLRPPEELQRKETIESFQLMPFIDEHEVLGRDATPAEKKGIQGVVGQNVYYDAPYLRGDLRVMSNAAMALIKSKQKVELSPAYRCKYEWTAGEFEGQHYDCRQYDIFGNHLALVKEGRTGPDVLVQDHATITFDTAEFITMTLAEMMEAIALLSDEEKAELLVALQPPTEDEPDEMSDEQRAESAEAAEHLHEAAERATTAAEAAERAAETGDTDDAREAAIDADDARNRAQEGYDANPTLDSLAKQIKALQKELAARPTMDTGAFMRSISERDNLASRISEHTGAFDHSTMTADQVAAYGVKKLGVKCAAGSERIAMDAWLQGRVPERQQQSSIAQDSRTRGNVKNKFWSE